MLLVQLFDVYVVYSVTQPLAPEVTLRCCRDTRQIILTHSLTNSSQSFGSSSLHERLFQVLANILNLHVLRTLVRSFSLSHSSVIQIILTIWENISSFGQIFNLHIYSNLSSVYNILYNNEIRVVGILLDRVGLDKASWTKNLIKSFYRTKTCSDCCSTFCL